MDKMDIYTNTLNRQLPKLTDEHVIRSKIKKMKVKCAAQIFSATLSAYIEYNSKIKGNLIVITFFNFALYIYIYYITYTYTHTHTHTHTYIYIYIFIYLFNLQEDLWRHRLVHYKYQKQDIIQQ